MKMSKFINKLKEFMFGSWVKVPAGSKEKEWGLPPIRHTDPSGNGVDIYFKSKKGGTQKWI